MTDSVTAVRAALLMMKPASADSLELWDEASAVASNDRAA